MRDMSYSGIKSGFNVGKISTRTKSYINIAQTHFEYVIMACLSLLHLSDKVNFLLHFCDKATHDDKIEIRKQLNRSIKLHIPLHCKSGS